MAKTINRTNLTKADVAGIVLVATIWGERLLYYVRSVLLRTPFIGQFSKPFITVVIVAVILFTFGYVKNRLRAADFAFVFIALAIYLFHMFAYPNNYGYLSENLPRMLTVLLPMYLLGVVCDIDKCIKVLINVSLAYVILGVLYYNYVTFVVGTYEMDTSADQMGIAYQYLPHVLLLLYATIHKFKIWYLAGFLLGMFMILGTGNRGSLLLVLVYATLLLLIGNKGGKYVKGLAVVALLVVALNINQIALFLSDIMGEVGMSIRSLDAFLEGDFTDDNGRQAILSALNQALSVSPMFGYGLAGDRYILGATGAYSHNLIYELMISFGPVFGVLVFIAIVALLVKCYLNCRNTDQKGFFFLLFCTGFLQLFLSNTFLFEDSFYMMLGYCVMIIRSKKYSLTNYNNEKNNYYVPSNGNGAVAGFVPERR